MKPSPSSIQRVYLVLILLNTLAASFIWGINTLFLLDAGLSNTQAFLANAFFTIGQVLFEVPTGVVADTKGRRTSYLLGTLTLAGSTLLYLLAWYLHAPLWLWGVASVLLGLGFSFFSGATEAWLVDALDFAGYKGKLESVFAKGQMVSGAAMLVGSVGGGLIAQATDLSVPYILRALLLLATFVIAFVYMKDWGWQREASTSVINDVKKLLQTSLDFGWRTPAARWVMLASFFSAGVGFYAFYAMQPFLLELYGNPEAYAVAGLAAAIVAGAQIVGGVVVPHLQKIFRTRTQIMLVGAAANAALLLSIGLVQNFTLAVILLCGWGLITAAAQPVRQAFLNGLIPSKQRATVLSFDGLLSSSGGVVIQPVLGRVADVWSYSLSFVGGAVFAAIAFPLTYLARKEKVSVDEM